MITNDLQNRIHFGDRDAFYAIYREYGLGIYAAARKALPFFNTFPYLGTAGANAMQQYGAEGGGW